MNVNHDQRVIIDQQHFVQNNKVLIQTHDPAYTEMLEQTAEARHRMAIAEAEAQANHRHEALTGSLSEALHIREAQEINQARMFLRENEENIKSEAVQHVRAHEAQCKEKVEAYQRILDANLRQSMATKESEIERLRSQAAEKERVQEERIKRPEELVMQQSLHNQKLQSMLDSQLSQPPPVQVVETATLTRMAEPYVVSAPIPACTVDPPVASEHPFTDPFDVEVVPPPYAPPPMLAGPYASNTDGATEDMVSGRIPAGGINITYCKQAESGSVPGPSHSVPLNNASGDQPPMSGRTVPYGGSGRKPSKGPNNGNDPGGNGDGGPGGGDDGDDGDEHDGSPVPSPSPAPNVNKKKDKKKAPGDGGGGGDDDPDKDSDDSDEKFVRCMKKFLGGGFNQSGNDEKPKVKEADTIKLPAISGPETYRNWRIKTREAIVAASTNPDSAFAWIGEVWKEGQTIEALRKVAPFATLDAKLLSALTNIITGDFARKVDTFKETEANEGRIVRGRQVLFMLHDHFSTNMKHGSTYALQDLFSVHLKGENLKTFISNWDQVLAGIVKVPEESVLETLFYNQVKNCIIEPTRVPRKEHMTSLYPLCAGTWIVSAWRATERGLLGICQAQPSLPLLLSKAR